MADSTTARRALTALVVAAFFCAHSDGFGETIEGRRVVALAPSAAEIIYKLGAQDRLVAVSSYADYPPLAKKEKPTVGGIINIDVERLLSLEPDLVISNPSMTAREKLEGLGIRLEFVADKTLRDVKNSFVRIGELVGKAEGGRALAREVDLAVEAAVKRVKDRPRVKALVVISHEPMWVAGGVGFLHELLEAAGGENIAAAIEKDFYGIDFERVVGGGPEIIIDLTLEEPGEGDKREAALGFWGRFSEIPAVKNGRVVFVESDLLTIPGPRLVEGLERLLAALYPERPGAEAAAAGREDSGAAQ